MKWRHVKPPPFDYTEWHPYFAWSPVKIGDYKYWLCTVMRRAHAPGALGEDLSKARRDQINESIHRYKCWDHWEYQEACYYC